MDPKCCLRFGQLNVGSPKVLGTPVAHVASQQVASFAELGPIPPGFDFSPDQFRPPVRLRRIYAIFGSLAWAYQALWLAVIPYAAFLLFSALAGRWVGGLLAAVVTLHFARHPAGTLARFLQYVVQERRGAGMKWPHSLRAGATAAGVAALAVLFVPACPVHIHGTAFLEPEERLEVSRRLLPDVRRRIKTGVV